MKKHFIMYVLLLTAIAVKAQEKFVIKGTLRGVKEPSRVVLQYHNGNEMILDSVAVKKGRFELKGDVRHPVKAIITLKFLKDDVLPMTIERYINADKQDFFLDKGTIAVTGTNDIKTAIINGGATQKDYRQLLSRLKPLEDEMRPVSENVRKLLKEKKDSAAKEFYPKLRGIRTEMNKTEDAFIAEYPDSYVSFDLVKRKASIIEPKTFEPFFNTLSERIRSSEEGKELANKLAIAKNTAIGQTALDFTQADTKNVPVSLSSLRGKYVLIDFWASWCGPCRAENPNVVKAYSKFKDKNFEILAVSLDHKKDLWLKAIEKDGLPWIHVSDLKGWNNEVAHAYGVTAVPQNWLIDPNGVVIAKNLRGDQLEKALEQLIK
ncbi:TlpA disulfide reductase family protein [Lacibacter sediminis]|uniref:AhpC/TSA family protein n=1 Tax=Lacibacter sediminis TaxID=2760713 RepID=A0A7G5XKH9_9BACT|nr:TlpA disulfide reductase family protein [Lacibacter sediminis]QNA45982.1 AhpC/TSA family protein [Lacibacter sediminis]